MPTGIEVIKAALDDFKKIQRYMLLARKENAVETYAEGVKSVEGSGLYTLRFSARRGSSGHIFQGFPVFCNVDRRKACHVLLLITNSKKAEGIYQV